jgi:hypothetical protein
MRLLLASEYTFQARSIGIWEVRSERCTELLRIGLQSTQLAYRMHVQQVSAKTFYGRQVTRMSWVPRYCTGSYCVISSLDVIGLVFHYFRLISG